MTRLRFADLASGAAGSTVDATLSGAHNNSTTTLTLAAALTYKNGTAVPTIAAPDYIMLSILDANGHVAEVVKGTAYTSAATSITVTRAQENFAAVSHSSGAKVRNAPTTNDYPGVGGGIIGYCQYAPATGVSKTTTSSTSADVDATNLIVTFTAPPSGLVLVTLGAYSNISVASSNFRWGLRAASADVTGSYMEVMSGLTASPFYVAASVVMTVTAGTSYTWKWAFKRQSGTGNCNIFAGLDADGGTAPALMKVEAIP